MSTSTPPLRRKQRVGLLSLGCPKTLVDSELILGKLDTGKFDLAPSVTDCDVALLNTCAFIGDAQKESIDHILELIALKKQGSIRKLVVMGCLTQRFAPELQREFKEVDAFIGSGEYTKISEVVERVTGGEAVSEIGTPGYLSTSSERRVSLTPVYSRYLKISEGCDHACSFCVIPSFRGKHRSRPLEDVVREAEKLVEEGARELILTGQDTAFFGYDTAGKFLLPELLRGLNALDGLRWIRVLYVYPTLVSNELVEALASLEKVCHYLDLPLQHVNDRVLKSMQRGTNAKTTRRLIKKLRRRIPDLALRTTFIVGHPGEGEKEFLELLDFIQWARFERMGIFIYSPETGSLSARLPGQVPEKTKTKRLEAAMLLQQEISVQNNARLRSRTFEVLVEGEAEEAGWLVGRTYMDAPEVDGTVYFKASPEDGVRAGQFVPLRIRDTREYDLVGELVPYPRP